MKIFRLLLAVAGSAMLFFSCEKCDCGEEGEQDKPLYMSSVEYSVKSNEERALIPESGNGNYIALSDDESVVVATGGETFIRLEPKGVGTAKITVSDKLDKTTTFNVRVEEPYIIWIFGSNPQTTVAVNNYDLNPQIAAEFAEMIADTYITPGSVFEFNGVNTVTVYEDYKKMLSGTDGVAGTYAVETSGLVLDLGDGAQSYMFDNTAASILNYMDNYFSGPRPTKSIGGGDMTPPLGIGIDHTGYFKDKYEYAGVQSVMCVFRAKVEFYKGYN